mmetsp:Transcript_9211/g.13870  ORF Transcript_9211/g.13870 Transcript_9211/m.13870 type:complete len:353 (-) Transcript_9211:2682-3740(-)
MVGFMYDCSLPDWDFLLLLSSVTSDARLPNNSLVSGSSSDKAGLPERATPLEARGECPVPVRNELRVCGVTWGFELLARYLLALFAPDPPNGGRLVKWLGGDLGIRAVAALMAFPIEKLEAAESFTDRSSCLRFSFSLSLACSVPNARSFSRVSAFICSCVFFSVFCMLSTSADANRCDSFSSWSFASNSAFVLVRTSICSSAPLRVSSMFLIFVSICVESLSCVLLLSLFNSDTRVMACCFCFRASASSLRVFLRDSSSAFQETLRLAAPSWIFRARVANCRANIVSSVVSSVGHTVTIIIVLEFPPKESWSRYVSLLFLYGTCLDFLSRPSITSPRAESDLLMCCVSFIA